MPAYQTSDIRNLALFGHAGSGKTTLAEAILFKAGALHHVGLVEKGAAAGDFTAEEKEHGHSLYNAVLHCDYAGKHINLIDTPGYPDFVGQPLSALPAVETVAVVINAAAGIESSARRLMERAAQRRKCRMIIVNRIDQDADLEALTNQIRETFGSQCVPVNLPTPDKAGVVDVFSKADGATLFGDAASAHTAIVEQVVEVDEELMAKYLEAGEVEVEQLHDAFEKALREGHLVPICFTAARLAGDPEKSVGVDALLDFFVKLAPSPLEGNAPPFLKGDDAEHEVFANSDPAAHVLAHVFQVTYDPFVGKLAAFRVHQGTITKDTQLYIGDPRHGESKKPFKVGHVFKLQGKEHVEVDAAIPGDIVAVAKVEEVHFNAVLHDSHDEDRLHLKPVEFPQPMQGLAVTARRRGDEQKIGDALHKICDEDPTFHVTRDASTHETVIHGLGDLHLRVILERLKHRYNIEVDTKVPKIAYRESISREAEGHHRHKKQTGGAGQFGEVYLRVKPLPRGAGFEFADETVGGNPPRQFLPAIEKGVRMVLEQGAVAGYPLQDVRVEVYDGKHHDVDSKEVAFITAGKRAFIDAVSKAGPTLLEPTVKIEVTVPATHMGDITGDLAGKRGRIQGTDMLGADTGIVTAVVPLAEVINYQSQLKSVTGGQGAFTMELSDYEPVPPHVQQQIVAQYKPKAEEE